MIEHAEMIDINAEMFELTSTEIEDVSGGYATVVDQPLSYRLRWDGRDGMY